MCLKYLHDAEVLKVLYSFVKRCARGSDGKANVDGNARGGNNLPMIAKHLARRHESDVLVYGGVTRLAGMLIRDVYGIVNKLSDTASRDVPGFSFNVAAVECASYCCCHNVAVFFVVVFCCISVLQVYDNFLKVQKLFKKIFIFFVKFFVQIVNVFFKAFYFI